MTRARSAQLLILVGLFAASPSCAPWWGDGGQAIVYSASDNACTLSPDVVGGACCYIHDLAYGQGGTESDRFAADAQLLACLAVEGVPEEVAIVYYRAVRRFGGSHWHAQP